MITRKIPINRYTRPKPKRAKPRRGPARAPEYLNWIRTLGCAVCHRTYGIEAAHTSALGARGMSQKTSDYAAIPLCSQHHRLDRDSYHQLGERRFAEHYDIEIRALVAGLHARCRKFE